MENIKEAEVPLPGGCNIGSRPIDLHLKGFRALGADDEYPSTVPLLAEAEKLNGSHIYLDMVSVGATINIMMAASMAEGYTIIENAAKEPHVVDVANFLNSMGANIKGAGTDVIRIRGVSEASQDGVFHYPGSDRGRYLYVCGSGDQRRCYGEKCHPEASGSNDSKA